MHEEEKKYANALNYVPEFGPKTLEKIRVTFGSFKKAWEAEIREYLRIPNLDKKSLISLDRIKKEINPDKELNNLEKEGVSILLSEELPTSLKNTPSAPEILYIRGSLPPETYNFLGVVGTRRYSAYGKEATTGIVENLAGHNFVIVSGLAKGIDSFSHETAIKNKIKTIAVLGSGLSPKVLFPKENKRLADRIVSEGGAVVSEYPYEMKANINSFPQRNRIIAGLSKAVWVVEAKEKSGSLITANYALDYDRDVLALPGSIFLENSKGTNGLIKQGAATITSAIDILNIFGIESENCISEKILDLSEMENNLLKEITEPIQKDELIRKTGLSAGEVIPVLTLLELKGAIKDMGGEIIKIAK
ncbi:DNA-protecting protein DprA [Candidatus Giovannonibacteria bacterium]|nr:DNA-protecting protein DprA [Candidatus Giovannonibacteria bacterium]